MRHAHERLERFYARALELYPAGFRAEYGEAMAQAFHDALEDPEWKRGPMLRTTARDLAVSLGKEWMAMMRTSLTRPALVCVSEHGTCFHAADCPWIRGRSVIRLQAAEAKKRFRPCKTCRPEL